MLRPPKGQVTKGLFRSSSAIKMLGSGFGRTDFSRIFIFGPPDFFADFLDTFLQNGRGKKCGKTRGTEPLRRVRHKTS